MSSAEPLGGVGAKFVQRKGDSLVNYWFQEVAPRHGFEPRIIDRFWISVIYRFHKGAEVVKNLKREFVVQNSFREQCLKCSHESKDHINAWRLLFGVDLARPTKG